MIRDEVPDEAHHVTFDDFISVARGLRVAVVTLRASPAPSSDGRTSLDRLCSVLENPPQDARRRAPASADLRLAA